MALTKAQLIDLNANELIIDLDADTSITADTDDQIDIKIAGADDFRFTANTFTALSGSSIVVPASGLTIGSTAVTSTAAELNLLDGGASTGTTAVADADGIITNDGGTMRLTTAATFKTYFQQGISTAYDDLTAGDAAVNITTTSGNITIDAAANDSDIIFKGTDNSADITMLTLDGSAAGDATFNNQVIIGDGKLVLNSTAVTSTAAELNLLDGVSGLVQADLTKLAAVDSTAAELNIVDGGTSATSTTVADADRVVLNDNGTMVQVAVTDLAAYFDDEITAMPNLVTTAATTVGALDSGSITSGFGAIDNGTSNIRSATITAETAFVPDAANGASLGTSSLEFADLYLHDGAQILFGADQDVVLTHAADVGLTLKTATTSDDTKATLTLQTGDTDIAANDVLGQLHFQAPDEGAGTDAILVAAGIAAISEGDFSASNNATKLSFQTGASEAASERMSISSTGATTITVADNSDTLTLKSTDADANVGPVLALHRDSGSPADNDIIGRIDFRGDNDAGEAINYASIFGKPSDITDGTEDFKLILQGMKAGTTRNLLQIGEDEVIVNEDSVDTDFRVESNAQTHMIHVDAGSDHVNIAGGGTDGGGVFNVFSADNTTTLSLVGTDSDASAGPILSLERSANSAADADFIGSIVYKGQNDANQTVEYGQIDVQIDDSSDGTEDGQLFIRGMSAGTLSNRIAVYGGSVVINDDSIDSDFRVESNGESHMLFVNADNDRIGILDSSPAYTLESGNSDSGKGWSLANENNVYKIRSRSTATDTQTHQQFENPNGVIGSIQTNSSSTSFNTSSDYRLKENVDYDWDATTRLKQLKPARFNWITDDTNTLLDGFIAHEVSSIVPEAISGTKDATETLTNVVKNADGSLHKCNFSEAQWIKGKEKGDFAADSTWAATLARPDYQSIDQSKLVPLLVKTIQELEVRIKTLEDA